MTAPRKNNREFHLIEKLFAPHADAKTAGHLRDDAASYTPTPGHDLVISTDMLVSGVHFPAHAAADVVAARLVGSNISDLAAKSAKPVGCLLNLAIGAPWDEAFLTDFAAHLGMLLAAYEMPLWGGDTVQSQQASVSLSVYGELPSGTMITRAGAQIGDDVYVTGVIGDGFLGLQHALAGTRGDSLAAYHAPRPPLLFGQKLRGLAHSCLDISDGLAADLDHLCTASLKAMRVTLADIPLSPEGQAYADGPETLADLLSGGDDYQLAFTAAPHDSAQLAELAAANDVRLSKIGTVQPPVEGDYRAEFVDRLGQIITLHRRGYQHF
jgi:thiamine-monophosphate kinase